MAPRQVALVPTPEQLVRYSSVDPQLPSKIMEAYNQQLQRDFRYAILSATYGLVALLSVVSGYVYLAIHGMPKEATGLLAAGVLSLIGGFVRSRLRT